MRQLLWARGVFELTKWFLLVVFVLLLLHNFVLTVFIVSGPSMEPNLQSSDGVLINRIVYGFSSPRRGDIVVVRYPGDPEESYYVKRVIGIPGDHLVIKDGRVSVNNKILNEGYIDNQQTFPDSDQDIPEGSYFTMGDNRSVSSDSRVWGVADRRFILGRVVLTLWPHIAAYPTPLY